MSLEPSEETLSIPLLCCQFPVCPVFSMTINKSQGQSVSHVGLDLNSPVFAHGQLYVALSHCTSGHRIKVLFPEGEQGTSTFNVVYPEVLQNILVSFIPHSLLIIVNLQYIHSQNEDEEVMVSIITCSHACHCLGKLFPHSLLIIVNLQYIHSQNDGWVLRLWCQL
jgi:hypothetical protein